MSQLAKHIIADDRPYLWDTRNRHAVAAWEKVASGALMPLCQQVAVPTSELPPVAHVAPVYRSGNTHTLQMGLSEELAEQGERVAGLIEETCRVRGKPAWKKNKRALPNIFRSFYRTTGQIAWYSIFPARIATRFRKKGYGFPMAIHHGTPVPTTFECGGAVRAFTGLEVEKLEFSLPAGLRRSKSLYCRIQFPRSVSSRLFPELRLKGIGYYSEFCLGLGVLETVERQIITGDESVHDHIGDGVVRDSMMLNLVQLIPNGDESYCVDCQLYKFHPGDASIINVRSVMYQSLQAAFVSFSRAEYEGISWIMWGR